MMGRFLLGALALLAVPLALAAPPEVVGDQGPLHGFTGADPVLVFEVAYTEPGYTDCNVPSYMACEVSGPATDAKLVRVTIEGRGSATFYVDGGPGTPTLLSGSCGSAGVPTVCLMPLAHEVHNGFVHMVVTQTTGEAGTVVSVHVDSGTSFFNF